MRANRKPPVSPWQHNGGAREGAGRKPDDPDNPLNERIMVRLSAAQRDYLESLQESPSTTIRNMIAGRMRKAK